MPRLELAYPGDAVVVVAALVAGVLADVAVRSGGAVLGGAVLVAVVAAILVLRGRLDGRQAHAVVGAAPVFGAFLALRASPWLLPLDVLAAGGLLLVGASIARSGTLLDLPLPGLVVREAYAAVHGLAAPAVAGQGLGNLRKRPGIGRSVLRGIALALPVLVVLGALLASADVLFAHIFDLLPDHIGMHLVQIAAGAWGMAGLLRVAAARLPEDVPRQFPLVGPVEATVVLGSVVALFAAFAVTQVVALAGGGGHVVRTAGLTYAEYARSGFFQLAAVAAVTLAVLLALEILVDPDPRPRRQLLILSELCIALTFVVVVSALRRLDLYENAYGLTMLRLYATIFVSWVGISLALLGVWLGGRRKRNWLPAAAATVGLAALLALNIANPEAHVVKRNVRLAARTGRFDAAYVAGLSADAVPELVRSLPRLDEAGKAALLGRVCAIPSRTKRGWAGWNGAEHTAVETRNQVCR